MIKIVKTLIFLALGFSVYSFLEIVMILLSYSNSGGYDVLSFGYPITLQWRILTAIYWFVLIVGLILIGLRKKFGLLFTNPLLILLLIYLCISWYNNFSSELFVVQIILVLLLFIFLNIKSTLKLLQLSPIRLMHHLVSVIVFLVFALLFLFLDKH